MKFAITLLGAIGTYGAAVADDQKPLQLLMLWDGTLGRLEPTFTEKFVTEGLQRIYDDHFGVFSGFSAFADKPAPSSGVGPYGGYPQAWWPYDFCYWHGTSFSSDIEDVTEALKNIPASTQLDRWDAQFEAILRAVYDPKLNWVPGTDRVIMLVTDSFGHSQALKTLKDNVDAFNRPVVCDKTSETLRTTGGFGATVEPEYLFTWVAPLNLQWEDLHAVYRNYTQLLADRVCNPDKVDPERDAQIVIAEEKLGPTTFPPVIDFDLQKLKSEPELHCRENEYPAYSDIVAALRSTETSLIVVFVESTTEPTSRDVADHLVWEWALTDESALGDVPSVLQVINRENLDQLPELVSAAVTEVLGKN